MLSYYNKFNVVGYHNMHRKFNVVGYHSTCNNESVHHCTGVHMEVVVHMRIVHMDDEQSLDISST